jgi:hypothetical protein
MMVAVRRKKQMMEGEPNDLPLDKREEQQHACMNEWAALQTCRFAAQPG